MTYQGSSKAPWIFSIIVVAGSAAGGYFLTERSAATERELQETQERLAALGTATRAELVRAEKKAEKEKARLLEKEQEAQRMTEKLKAALGDANGELSSEGGALTLKLVDKVLFRLGEADLTDNGKRVLAKVGNALQSFPDKQVWVQGHTDNVPVSKNNEEFLSNWELSATRAVNVVHYLEDEVGVDPRRLAAVAFSEYRPVSKSHKKRNRRIEIVLAPGDVSISR